MKNHWLSKNEDSGVEIYDDIVKFKCWDCWTKGCDKCSNTGYLNTMPREEWDEKVAQMKKLVIFAAPLIKRAY